MKILDASVDQLTAFNDFIKNNALWIALIVLGIIVTITVVIIVTSLKKNKEKERAKEVEDILLTSLGGKDNIDSYELKGTRIVIKLKDFNLLNEEKLNDLNVSYIKMSDKITIVSKNDSKKLSKLLS